MTKYFSEERKKYVYVFPGHNTTTVFYFIRGINEPENLNAFRHIAEVIDMDNYIRRHSFKKVLTKCCTL